MNFRIIGTLSLIILVVAGLIAVAFYFGSKRGAQQFALQSSIAGVPQASTSVGFVETVPEASPVQAELDQLSEQMIADLRAENRLNLNMLAQLRSYQEMLRQIEGYAKKVEKDLTLLEEISKDEFQEDVQLQAALFGGKKPELVAKHLEEFRAERVGAILSKMKDKEASAVLDVWAKQKSPKVSAFYREVTSAYLNNKRRDLHPELFKEFSAEADKK